MSEVKLSIYHFDNRETGIDLMLMRKQKTNWKRRLYLCSGLPCITVLTAFVFLFFNIVTAEDTTTILFPSEDKLSITADVYIAQKATQTPLIVMFHQASWSRGEFNETALRFNKMGYNCLTVDLRSGHKVLGVINQTARRAKQEGKKTRFIDAYQDVRAALSHARRTYPNSKIIALGSSYSAGLLLKVAGEYPHLVDGVIAFSPAESFFKEGMPYNWVQDSAKKIKVPVFFTSARNERFRWKGIYDAIDTNSKLSYIPAAKGKHGARALWSKFEESEGYWQVIETFLKSFF